MSSEEKSDRRKLKELKIGLFGKRGSGKSALINALLGEDESDVTETKETTYKAMEINGIGPVTIVDTAGLDGGEKRVKKTQEAAKEIDVALILIANDSFELELAWISRLNREGSVVIPIISQIDKLSDEGKHLAAAVSEATGKMAICVSAKKRIGIEELRDEIVKTVR